MNIKTANSMFWFENELCDFDIERDGMINRLIINADFGKPMKVLHSYL